MDFVYWLEIENYFLNIIWVGHIILSYENAS